MPDDFSSGYSLIPVDYQPEFEGVTLVPVDHNPFASGAGSTQLAQAQAISPPQQPATAAGPPDVGAPIIGDGGQFSAGTAIGNKVADIGSKVAYGLAHQILTLPQRAIDASAMDVQHLGEDGYTPQSIDPAVETALMTTGLSRPFRNPSGLATGTAAESAGLGQTQAGGVLRAAESPEILAEELLGRTRSQIRDLAADKGLVPKGDPSRPDYPQRWHDPVTNNRRLRLDKGHIDAGTGKPYDTPNAAVDHVHVYDADGVPITINDDPHIPTIGE